MQNTTSSHGFVYLIRAIGVDRVKVGFSTDPSSRLASMRTGSPVELEIVKVWNGTMADEKMIHRLLANTGTHLEWFNAAAAYTSAIIDAYFDRTKRTEPPRNPKKIEPPKPELPVEVSAYAEWRPTYHKDGTSFVLMLRHRYTLADGRSKRVSVYVLYLNSLEWNALRALHIDRQRQHIQMLFDQWWHAKATYDQKRKLQALPA